MRLSLDIGRGEQNMKKIIVYFSSAFLILFYTTPLFAADNTISETRDAIVRDAKSIKEQVPNDIKEVKKEFIKKSNEVKTSTTQELKDIREGLSKPIKPVTSETKAN
jgi:gas vesicle protein